MLKQEFISIEYLKFIDRDDYEEMQHKQGNIKEEEEEVKVNCKK